MQYVKKRDGRIVNFNKNKIVNAILKAFEQVDGEISEYALEKANNIADFIQKRSEEILTVEEIQDLVENGLMSLKKKNVARAYIRYRQERARIRNWNTKMMDKVVEKIEATNVQNQNANVDEYSFGGRRGEADAVLLKQYALDNLMSEMARNNHLNNEIYIHDLGHYPLGDHNCLSVPFDKLLANGFDTRQTDIRPANSVNTAFQLLAVIFQLQSLNQFGGVSATHLDWTMVPYVRKSFYKHYKDGLKWCRNSMTSDTITIPEQLQRINDKTPIDAIPYQEKCFQYPYRYAMDMTIKEIEQAVEGMYHNLNTLQSRSGNQLPFTSINYGTCTLLEGRMITKALLNGSIKGVGKFHKTPIFPCGIFQLMKGVNREPGDPNYDLYRLALKSTAQRLYPNYANVDWSGNAGYDREDPCTYFSTMGKRKLQPM